MPRLRPSCRRLAVALGVAAAGCQAPRDAPSVYSDDPDLKVLAIKRDVDDHDPQDEPALVHDLDDRDPAVRFYSIQGLERLTGLTLGYRSFDDEPTRAAAVARWHAWLAAHPRRP